MKLSLYFFLTCASLFANMGDHAMPIPASYIGSHPRLPHPSAADLTALWNGRATIRPAGTKYIFDIADAWPGVTQDYKSCRQLLTAEMAARQAGATSQADGYLAKVQLWQKSNWNSVSGSSCESWAYDWLYSELDVTTRARFMADIQSWLGPESDPNSYQGSAGQTSPYNDVQYLRMTHLGLMIAIAVYSPTITLENTPLNLFNLRYALDFTFNNQVPVWYHVIGAGRCGKSLASDITCGGGTYEIWEYVNGPNGFGQIQQMGPTLLCWGWATQNYPGIFTNDFPWFYNLVYQLPYQKRGDLNLEHLQGQTSGGLFQPEYDLSNSSSNLTIAGFGSMEIIAEAYNDPIGRGLVREHIWKGTTPTCFEPSGYPYLSPDCSTKTATSSPRLSLSKVKDFPGWGVVSVKTGFGEDDTSMMIEYGDSYWTKPFQRAGAFYLYSRGTLISHGGAGKSGTAAPHYRQYLEQSVAHSEMTFTDSADFFSSELYPLTDNDGSTVNQAIENDGGQKRMGSGHNLANGLAQALQQPNNYASWVRNRELYKGGSLIGLSTGLNNAYTWVALDLTNAYNNYYSKQAHTGSYNLTEANTSNRTYRVASYKRMTGFIPRGTGAVVIVVDHAVTANSAFKKRYIIHPVEPPTISGNQYTITRNRTVSIKPAPGRMIGWKNINPGITHCPGGNCDNVGQYTYAGTLDGWLFTFPSSANTPCPVGGTNHEFDLGADCNPDGTVNAYGTNYNHCSASPQCDITQQDYGYNSVLGEVHPDITVGGSEPGWGRIEMSTSAAHLEDWFVNIMWARNVADTGTVSVAGNAVDDGNGNLVITLTISSGGNPCAYSFTLPKQGTEPTISAIGAGCPATI